MSNFSLNLPTYLEPAWSQLSRDGQFSKEDLESLKATAANQQGSRVQEALETQSIDTLSQKLATDRDGSLTIDKVQLHPQSQSIGHAILEVSLVPESRPAAQSSVQSTPTEPSVTEMDWASRIELKIQKEKYQPQPKELERMKDIGRRYLESRRGQPAPSPAELEWANTIHRKVQTGGKPTAEELSRFRDISARQLLHFQAAQARLPEPTQPPSQADLTWAMDFKQRVEQKHYQPNQDEMLRFQQIGRAHQKFSQPAAQK